MARVTHEDCIKHVPNMYDLVILAAKRSRQLQKGSEPLVRSKNRMIVTSLREIADAKVLPDGPNPAELSQSETPASDMPN